MADSPVSSLTPRGTPDRAVDQIYVINSGAQYRSTINNELGITGTPVGTTDSQTLTNKVLTSPTINGATLSGTLSGTYTLGGTPTFPASVVTLTGSQTLTNKVLTSPTISSPTITNASITQDSVVGFTTANSGTVYGVSVTGGTISGASLTSSSIDYTKVATGFMVQVVATNYTASATGTTVLPSDDTIPQNTEGDQFMTQVITPKSSSNRLLIEANIMVSGSIAPADISAALFQDTTVNAIAAMVHTYTTATYMQNIKIVYDMLAGTTSATTFKVRAGLNSAGTTTFNGQSGTRRFGGVAISNIKIMEYKA